MLSWCLGGKNSLHRESREGPLAERPGGVFLFFLPIALSECLFRPHWHGGAQNLYDDWANFCSYLAYFIFGYLFGADPRFGQALDHAWKYLVITTASLVGSVLIYDIFVKRTNITRMFFGMKPLAD